MVAKEGLFNYEVFLKQLKEKPTATLLTEPIKDIVKNKTSKNVEVEVTAMQILLAVKLDDDRILEKKFGLDTKTLKTKLSRTVTKTLIVTILEAINILEKLRTTPKDYLQVLKMLKDNFTLIQEGKQEVKAEETAKEYKNEHMKEVLVQFETNQSFVYLLSIVNRAYAEELPIARVNRILASLEILASIRETNENKNIEFGKMTLNDLRNLMKGSLSLDVSNICYNAILALNERTNEISEATQSLLLKIKELKGRFEHIVNKLRES